MHDPRYDIDQNVFHWVLEGTSSGCVQADIREGE